jgi:hypothetical protein
VSKLVGAGAGAACAAGMPPNSIAPATAPAPTAPAAAPRIDRSEIIMVVSSFRDLVSRYLERYAQILGQTIAMS